MLQKDITQQFIPGSPGVPAIPGSPARPAYTEVVRTTTRVFVTDSYRFIVVPYNELTLVPEHTVSIPQGHYENRTVTSRITHPAQGAVAPVAGVPATPAQWRTNHNIGWNAGAHSLARRTGDMRVTFKIPAASGTIVGLNDKSSGVDFAEIKHALYFRQGIVRAYESGVPKGQVSVFVPADDFTVERVNGVVTYYKNRQQLYQSTVSSTGSLIVDASMYSGGDRID